MSKYSFPLALVSIFFLACKTPVVEKKKYIPVDESPLFEEITREEVKFQPRTFKNTAHDGDVKLLHSLSNTSFHVYNAAAFDSNEKGVLVGGSSLRIRSTINSGKNWSDIRLSRFADAFHSVAISNGAAFVVGEGSFIVKSDSTLRNWSVFDLKGLEGLVSNSQKFYKIKFNNQIGFAMGVDTGIGMPAKPCILKTEDGGKNWSVLVHTGLENEEGAINDFDMVTDSILYIVTQTGNTYKTEDGGSSWHNVFTPQQEYTNLNSIDFKDDKTGFIGGISGLLYFTDNGGQNWKQNSTFKDAPDLNISDIKYLSDEMVAITTAQSFVDEERPIFTYLLDGDGQEELTQPLLTKRDSSLFFEGDAFHMFLLKKERLFIVDRNNVYALDTKDLNLKKLIP